MNDTADFYKRLDYRRNRWGWFPSMVTLDFASADAALERERHVAAQENQRHLGRGSRCFDFADSILSPMFTQS
jgi:hypothetical protein